MFPAPSCELNRNAIRKRRYKAGEIVCREAEYGSTAYYILEGTADVYISSPVAHAATRGTSHGLLQKMKNVLVNRNEQKREGESSKRYIPIDAPIDLPYENPVGQLGPGDLFGEMACMNYYPRSATVRAKTDCVMLEMLRNVLDILQRNKTFRARVDQNYRKRALETQLRTIPMFASIDSEFIDYLRDRVELRRYAPGQVICRQGEPSHSFFLVRIGFVKVTQSHPGGDLTLGYLGRGNFFGELSLLGGGVRTATCIALDHVEAVRIRAEEFKLMLDRFPEVRKGIEEVARQRTEENRARLASVQNVPVDSFLAQGLMEAQSLLVLDLRSAPAAISASAPAPTPTTASAA